MLLSWPFFSSVKARFFLFENFVNFNALFSYMWPSYESEGAFGDGRRHWQGWQAWYNKRNWHWQVWMARDCTKASQIISGIWGIWWCFQQWYWWAYLELWCFCIAYFWHKSEIMEMVSEMPCHEEVSSSALHRILLWAQARLVHPCSGTTNGLFLFFNFFYLFFLIKLYVIF